MKAKEYFEKYDTAFRHASAFSNKAEHNDTCIKLMTEMSNECYDVAKKRNVQTEHALVGVVEEFNNKWNALVSLFEKAYGVSPIIRNGFRDMYCAIGKKQGFDYGLIVSRVQARANMERDLMTMVAKEMNARNG